MVSVPWQVLAGVTFLAYLVGLLTIGYWVFRDARERGSDGSSSWAIAAALFPLMLVVYVFYRSRIGERGQHADQRERAAGSYIVGFLLAFVSGALLSPPDPFSQLLWFVGALPVGLLVGYLLVWQDGWRKLHPGSTA